MSFAVAADSYDRFMGRYARPLAPLFVDFARLPPTGRALDVGCGTGALTTELVRRLGTGGVNAVDPSTSFVAAVAERHPGIRVQQGHAEHLPFAGASFDTALAQLVVHFMNDPVAGVSEMARVTRPGGSVAACVWDHAEGGGPLHVFWEAVHQLDPTSHGEADLPGTRQGDLGDILRRAGLTDVEETALTIAVEHDTFDEWWTPFTLGVGPAGALVASSTADTVASIRERCRVMLTTTPIRVGARAWAARGRVAVTS